MSSRSVLKFVSTIKEFQGISVSSHIVLKFVSTFMDQSVSSHIVLSSSWENINKRKENIIQPTVPILTHNNAF